MEAEPPTGGNGIKARQCGRAGRSQTQTGMTKPITHFTLPCGVAEQVQVQKEKCYEGHDDDFDSYILDEDKVRVMTESGFSSSHPY